MIMTLRSSLCQPLLDFYRAYVWSHPPILEDVIRLRGATEPAKRLYLVIKGPMPDLTA